MHPGKVELEERMKPCHSFLQSFVLSEFKDYKRAMPGVGIGM